MALLVPAPPIGITQKQLAAQLQPGGPYSLAALAECNPPHKLGLKKIAKYLRVLADVNMCKIGLSCIS